MRAKVWSLTLLLGAGLSARAEEPRLAAVLPLDVTHAVMDAASRMALEEGIRTLAGEVLDPAGYTVLTGETTLKVLENNGIDAQKACEASCAMEAALELKASLFVSGSVATTEGEHVAYVRLFESATGRQLGAVQVEGRTVKELRKAFEARASRLFARITTTAPAPSPVAPAARVAAGDRAPVVQPSRAAAAQAPASDLPPEPAARPSFDCRKARGRVELAICQSTELAALDVRLSELYSERQRSHADPKSFRQEQRRWLADRDTCGRVGTDEALVRCVAESFRARITALAPDSP